MCSRQILREMLPPSGGASTGSNGEAVRSVSKRGGQRCGVGPMKPPLQWHHDDADALRGRSRSFSGDGDELGEAEQLPEADRRSSPSRSAYPAATLSLVVLAASGPRRWQLPLQRDFSVGEAGAVGAELEDEAAEAFRQPERKYRICCARIFASTAQVKFRGTEVQPL